MSPIVTEILPAIIEFAPDTVFSGAMRRLPNNRFRAFVIAMLESPTLNLGNCARRAGFSGNDDTMRSTGYRLAHDPRVLDAIQEEAKNRMASGAIYAVSYLLEILQDPKTGAGHKLRAVEMLLNRVGLHAKTEVTQNVNHTVTGDAEMIKRIELLSKQLGMDPAKLLGNKADVIEADFRDVTEGDDDLSDIV